MVADLLELQHTSVQPYLPGGAKVHAHVANPAQSQITAQSFSHTGMTNAILPTCYTVLLYFPNNMPLHVSDLNQSN